MEEEKFIITIDGTAGAGKSTIAKLLAKKYNLKYLPTGIYYRKLAKIISENNLNIENISEIKNIMFQVKDACEDDLNDKTLYPDNISYIASKIAKIKELREYFLSLQRNFINNNNRVVLEGRDTGTIVAPDANIKIFLTADSLTRAKRRGAENIQLSQANIEERDRSDSTRDISPLIAPENSLKIDTSNLGIEEVIKIISNYINIVN